MSLNLQEDLRHQNAALNAVNRTFEGVKFEFMNNTYQNPVIDLTSEKLRSNIATVQSDVHKSLRGSNEIDEFLNLDIKMETGTGKTYVYTKTMFELHKNYGFNKFIILVPTTAIKEGTKQFIQSDYARRHFMDLYEGTEIKLSVLDSQKNSNKGRKMFPSAISQFVSGSKLVKNRIHVLLMNSQMLTSKATMANKYDQTVF